MEFSQIEEGLLAHFKKKCANTICKLQKMAMSKTPLSQFYLAQMCSLRSWWRFVRGWQFMRWVQIVIHPEKRRCGDWKIVRKIVPQSEMLNYHTYKSRNPDTFCSNVHCSATSHFKYVQDFSKYMCIYYTIINSFGAMCKHVMAHHDGSS